MTPYHSNFPISIKGLSVSYGRKRVLTNIFLNVPAGAIVGVIGPNGAGKSTLFKSILGLIDANAGDVKVHGQNIEDVRKRLAYVPQKDDVDWTFPATVNDVVLMGRYPHKGIFQSLNKQDREIANDAMRDLSILDLKDRQIGELSGGQQQRVFIARALAQEADLFFLDEPFVGVDMLTEEKIIELLKRLREENKTTLVVHHDLSTVEEYFDHVILLNQRLVAFGKTEDVFTSENVNRTYGAQLNILHKSHIEK
jgi:ABC-type Mn2+/Zn2+ transport system ATPase subunit